MLTNYHTHHYRCGHASGTIEDYVLEAIKHGYTEIGISCHAPFENVDVGHRMKFDELDDYFTDIKAVREKYNDQITVLSSLEIEYFPSEIAYLKEMRTRTNYLLLAQHFIELNGKLQSSFSFTHPLEIEAYAKQAAIAMDTGLFDVLVHPDLFMIHYPKWDETCEKAVHTIAKSAIKNNIILEINANGFRNSIRNDNHERGSDANPYPVPEFWAIVRDSYPEVKVIVGSDCHAPELLNDKFMQKGREFAKLYKLNVIDALPKS